MKNPLSQIDRIIMAIELFSEPCTLLNASDKLCCTERTVYRIIKGLTEDGFKFNRLAEGMKISEYPESLFDKIQKLNSLIDPLLAGK